jgi:hypothetical protein
MVCVSTFDCDLERFLSVDIFFLVALGAKWVILILIKQIVE